MIKAFRGQYFFLSNFYNAPIIYKGIQYLNNEAAFQAQKTLDDKEREKFSKLQPGEAKRLGKRVLLRSGWEDIKDDIMYEICKEKFIQHSELRKMLIDTQEKEIVEDNNWNDIYWGVSNNKGQNRLGKILMRIRSELK